MLRDHDAGATVAVTSIQTARPFYEGMLGLEPVNDMGQAVVYRSGRTELLVYESEYAGANKATAVTWNVGEAITGLAAELKRSEEHTSELQSH